MDPILQNLKVPCVCELNQTRTPFDDFPKRHGFDATTLEPTGSKAPVEPNAPVILQSWLCFGLLAEVCEICNVQFNPQDLVVEVGDCIRISYFRLEQYLWYCMAASYGYTIEESRAHMLRYIEVLQVANDVVNLRNRQHRDEMSNDEGTILVSIMALVDYLAFNYNKFFQPSMFQTPLTFDWVRSHTIDGLLLEAGWCFGELPVLHRQCSPVVLLHHAFMDRIKRQKDHSRCTYDACLANDLDSKTYEPSHASNFHTMHCKMINSPVQDICDILTSGGIPVVRISEEESDALSIEVGKFVLGDQNNMPPYTAISHVWSDGMGNVEANGLNACQLKRIQSRVNALYPETKRNHFFWMDTLCVPLNVKVRNLAIIRMTKTYAHATNVLVLDTWLEDSGISANPRDLLAGITRSDWNQRLWTYQEVKLARECRFQLKLDAPAINLIQGYELDTKRAKGNFDRVMNHLLSLNEKEFVEHNYLGTLLKGVLHFDDSTLANATYYGSLPPQDDEDMEDFRLQSIQILQEYEQQAHFRQKWASTLAKLGKSTTPIPDPVLLKSLKLHLESINDPVLRYGVNKLNAMRGLTYPIALDREQDMAGKAERQLTGLSSKPPSLLTDVVVGVEHRSTSRLEDETICISLMLGMDVSRLLKVGVGQRSDEEVRQACTKRMTEFLTMLSTINLGLLISHGPRLQEKGFSWAPRSFMGTKLRFSGTMTGTVTPNGLLTSDLNILQTNIKLANLLTKEILSIKVLGANHTWNLRHDMTYFEQLSDEPAAGDVAFLYVYPWGFLARVIGHQDNVLHFKYIAYAQVIEKPLDIIHQFEGHQLGRQKVCIN